VIAGIGAVDWFLLAVLAVSVVIGLVRGLIFEVMALAGWVVAFFAAQWFAGDLLPYLPLALRDMGADRAVAFGLVFLGALIVWGLLARLVRLLLHATPLSVIDRVGGGAFGIVRGALVLLVLATVVRVTPAAQSPLWQASVGAGWLDRAVRVIQPLLPGVVGSWLPGGTRN
jgi:membrane protein required for colicin V production